MAQNSATVTVEGKIVGSERKNGKFTDREDPTRTVEYDYIEAKLVTESFDVIYVRFPSDQSIAQPPADQPVQLVCDARPSGNNLKLSVKEVRALVAAGHRA